MSSDSEFLPVPMAPAFPKAIGGDHNGAVRVEPTFLLSGDAMRAAFTQRRVYPVELAAATVYDAALQLYLQWMDLTSDTFDPSESPWLPIGRVGPALVLGHHDLTRPMPLPASWFQPVLLKAGDYERHLRICGPLIERAPKPDWDEKLAAPRREYPGLEAKLVRPTTMRSALRFMLEYFPHDRDDLVRIQELLVNSDDIAPEELPPGYYGACWLLLEQGGIADPTVVAPPDGMLRRIPEVLAARIRIVSEFAHNVWVGMERLPQPDVEDLLLNELGDGWHVHFLLLDGIRYIDKIPGSESHPERKDDGDRARNAGIRARVKIESARSRSRGADERREPGKIELSQKDIWDLEAYNERRADREPVKVFLKRLSAGIIENVTDLHIEMNLDSYRIRARIDGLLEEWLEMPLEFGRMVVGAAKERFGMAPERFVCQDGNCTVFHGSDVVNVRVHAYPIRGEGQKLEIRYLPRRGSVPRLADLMPAKQAGFMLRAITRPFGLVLNCGPTGSGKTTTLFSALREINNEEINITTMEDPVEYEMDGLNQAELDVARGLGWEELLKGFLRQDPDVGMVGEIRDRETAETAIRLALTGHIVFGTLHTMSCAHTVERLVDMGVNAQMFSNAVTLIVSQRLVRRLCKRCKVQGRRPPNEAERRLFERHEVEIPEVIFDEIQMADCEHCRGRGYKGRIAAFEMLPITEEVAQLIADKRPAREIEQWMKRNGHQRVYQAALSLVTRGETTLAEANDWQPVWEGVPNVTRGNADKEDGGAAHSPVN